MRTARSLPYGGVCPGSLPDRDPSDRDPQTYQWTETPLDRDPPWTETPWTETPPVNRMTHRCKNITLPQTSFAGGKKLDGLLEVCVLDPCSVCT